MKKAVAEAPLPENFFFRRAVSFASSQLWLNSFAYHLEQAHAHMHRKSRAIRGAPYALYKTADNAGKD